MDNELTFASREDFRTWLCEHCLSDEGVWLVFGKTGGPATLKASEALEEALCFGWIDGKMQKIDELSYRKYFSKRRANSRWSVKNQEIVASLEARGLMTDHGRAKIAEAKANGQWDAPKDSLTTAEEIAQVAAVLEPYEVAHENFLGLSPWAQKTYARAYLDAQTDIKRKRKLAWMIDRLNRNLNPV